MLSMAVTYEEIEKEFNESLGYIQGDIQALCGGTNTLNYTVALLVGVACEALEDARAYPSKIGVFQELLPDADWKKLATQLFDAIRHGLAHRFDTKHIHVDGKLFQIYLSWNMTETIRIRQVNGRDGLFLGTCQLGAAICKKIQEFRTKLQNDPEARQAFRDSLDYGRTVECRPELWDLLKQKP